MFAKTICLSDAFLDMPLSARCLYFTLGLLADDDGFINSPKSVMRQCGASQDDLALLLQKKFVLAFDSGVIVIKHWRINNYLRSDRYSETKYLDEKAQLMIEENGAYRYTSGIPAGIPTVYPDKDKLEQDKLDKTNIVERDSTPTRFVPPTPAEVSNYCATHNYKIDAERFVDYYTARGWMIGKNKIKDWKACVRTWVRIDKPTSTGERDISDEVF